MKIFNSFATGTYKIFIQGTLILLFAVCSIVGVLFYSVSGHGPAAINVDSSTSGYSRLVQVGSEIEIKLKRIDQTEKYFITSTTARLDPDKTSVTAIATARLDPDKTPDSVAVTSQSGGPKSSNAERRYQYMLSFHYPEQLTMASRHFVSFVNLAAPWGMRAVEPLVLDSRLYGLHLPRKVMMYDYSRLFDLPQANRMLGSCLLGPNQGSEVIFKLKNFLADSYRNIVLVYFVTKVNIIVSKESNAYFMSTLRSAAKAIMDCTDAGKTMGVIKNFENRLNSQKLNSNYIGHQEKFVISRMICVDYHTTVSLTNLSNLIARNWKQNYRESVLFIIWQGQRTAYKFDEPSQELMQKCKLDVMPRSAEVLNTSKLFLQSLAIEKPFLSVHLRIEKVIQRAAFNPDYINCCTQEVLSVINNTLHKYHLKGTLVFSDYGMYGTDACRSGQKTMPISFCKTSSDKILKRLSQVGIQRVEFDVKTFSGVPQNSGFASLVESHALVQGDMLVAMGGGSFQSTMRKNFVTLSQYFHNYTAPEHNWISVCPGSAKETCNRKLEV